MKLRLRSDLIGAALALAGAGAHLLAARMVGRWPASSTVEQAYITAPLVLAVVGALALGLLAERRPQAAACVWTWLMVLFTLPANLLGLAFVPGALLMTLALFRPGARPAG